MTHTPGADMLAALTDLYQAVDRSGWRVGTPLIRNCEERTELLNRARDAIAKAKQGNEGQFWRVEKDGSGYRAFRSGDWAITTARENEASAQLIADLLAAVRKCEKFLDNQADVYDSIPNHAMRLLEEVRAAIAKAEGLPQKD
jgi:hypothetical protein